MRKTLTLTDLLTAGLLSAGPAVAQTIHYPPAMQQCAQRITRAIHRIQRLRHDPTLDATHATRATRAGVERLVLRDAHMLTSIFGRLQHDAAFRRGPAGTRDICLLARAYEADARALALAVQAGQSARRSASARSSGGAAAGVAGLLPQSDRAKGPSQYTHMHTVSVGHELTDTRQRFTRAERSRTHGRETSTTHTISRDYSHTSEQRIADQQTVGATRVTEMTETGTLLCPTWGCPTSERALRADGYCGGGPGQIDDCRAYTRRPLSAPSASAARRIVAQGQRAARSARAAARSSPLTHHRRP